MIVCHMTKKYLQPVNSRQNDARASMWLHGHDTLVQKYDAITLVWTEMNRQMWINNDIDNWQTGYVVLPLTYRQNYRYSSSHTMSYSFISTLTTISFIVSK